MLLTYYTLRHLAAEWDNLIRGARLIDAWSQQRDELSLALESRDGEASTIVTVLRPGRRLLFRNLGRGRARRHTASLFESAVGHSVTGVHVAHCDRMLFVDLGDDLAFQIVLFGPRPNVWLVNRDDGTAADSFAAAQEWVGDTPPSPRPAPEVGDFEAFDARWPRGGTTERAVSRAMPLFDATLAAEAIFRAGIQTKEAAEVEPEGRRRLFTAAREIEASLQQPDPRIYWDGERAEVFSLIELRSLQAGGLRAELFPTVGEAVRIFSHRTLRQERFEQGHAPLLDRLRQAHARAARSAERMIEELDRPSRADEHERFGHLLMAQATGYDAGRDEITVPDIMGSGQPVTIPLDPALTAIENAEQYYDRARRSRQARRHVEARWEEVHHRAELLGNLRERLEAISSLDQLDRFVADHEEALDQLLGSSSEDEAREPYRRFPLPGGLEAWVGKNARGNAEMTTRHAGPHDLWLHARGYPGSHVVIRRPGRGTDIPREAVEAAAGLAAYFSKGRSSGLVPVQVTERKHVRTIKGGPPGAVRLDREEVLLVAPTAPRH